MTEMLEIHQAVRRIEAALNVLQADIGRLIAELRSTPAEITKIRAEMDALVRGPMLINGHPLQPPGVGTDYC